jgi:hypothetical protein
MVEASGGTERVVLLQAQKSDHCLLLPLTYPKRRGLLETPGKYYSFK